MKNTVDFQFLCHAAARGCFVRQLYILGEEQSAHEECNGGEAQAQLLIKLINSVEADIRGGITLAGALMNADKKGFSLKLRNFESWK